MPATRYPFQMVCGVPVVTTPAEIDLTTAGQLQTILSDWHSRGHVTVVVDMTGTQFCDSAGLRELVLAHKRAVPEGGGLRLVIPAGGAVLRVFTVTGLDRVIPRFAALHQALAQVPAAAGRTLRHGPHPQTATATAGPPAQVPEHMGDPAVEASALSWSVSAMSEATARLPTMKVWDRPRAFAAIGEAVWRITIVDAALMRHHPGVYDAVMASKDPAQRRLIDQTLAGLRFARNLISRDAALGEVFETGGTGASNRRVNGWMWKGVPEPRGQAWEMDVYRAYEAHLAGHTIGQTLGRAATFLTLTSANATSATAMTACVGRERRES